MPIDLPIARRNYYSLMPVFKHPIGSHRSMARSYYFRGIDGAYGNKSAVSGTFRLDERF